MQAHRFANFYLLVFAIDGLLSLLVAVFALSDRTLVGAIQLSLATLVVVCTPPMFLWMALDRRLPISVFLPLVTAVLWLSLGGAPLPLLADESLDMATIGSLVQLGFAAASFALTWRATSGRGWLFGEASMEPAYSFSLGRPLGFGLAGGLLGLPAFVLFLVASGLTYIQVATQSFVSFDLEGVSMSERQYRLGSKRIDLIGMMHIGEGDAYDRLFESFAVEDAVVLEEGVTDDQRILERTLSYDKVALGLGLETQGSVSEFFGAEPGEVLPEWPHTRHVDVDVSDFSPDTRKFLEDAASVWQADDPVAAFLELMARPMSKEAIASIQYDIVDRRNEVVIQGINDALPEYDRVIVPWGALHLPGIEAAVLEAGFTQTSASERRLVAWSTLFAALF